MPVDYQVILKSPAGVKQAVITDFLELTYKKRIWEPGALDLKLLGNHKDYQYFVNNAQLEVWRRNLDFGIDWYCDFQGLYRKEVYETTVSTDYFTATCPGQMTMLSWPYVMFPDRLEGFSVFTAQPAETIMKKLVKYNLTSFATTGNGRLTDWPSTVRQKVTIETDLGRGNVRDWKCSNVNLLGTIQDLATIAGGDFDLVKTGPTTWDFRFYPGQLGTDRTATVKFSQAFGNMFSPRYEYDRINEATFAVIGGTGDGETREFETVAGDDYDPIDNHIETFVHASNADTDNYLIAKGQEYLYAAKARKKLPFKVLQTPAVQYGRDYFLGDLVTAYYRSQNFIQKIFGVTVMYRPNAKVLEEINVEMRDA